MPCDSILYSGLMVLILYASSLCFAGTPFIALFKAKKTLYSLSLSRGSLGINSTLLFPFKMVFPFIEGLNSNKFSLISSPMRSIPIYSSCSSMTNELLQEITPLVKPAIYLAYSAPGSQFTC